MWPSLVDMSKDDCRKALRTLELETYGGMVDVLRAQGHFSSEKKKLLADVAAALSIPLERHKAEIRRAVNDERLNSIAEVLVGPNTATDWAIEGRRMIPLLPRPRENTVYSVIADECADYVSTERETYISEDGYRAAECPFSIEPASPEPSKTQTRSASPSGVLVFPSGTAVQMKREASDDDGDRKKRRALAATDAIQFNPTGPSSPKVQPGNQHLSINSRAVTSSPLKIALPTGNRQASNAQNFTPTPKQLIIVSNASSPNTSSILQKTLSFPMKANAGKSTVIYTQSSASNTPEGLKQRAKGMQSTPLAKGRNTIVVSQKTPMKTPMKHVMPMQTKIVMQQKGGAQSGGVQRTPQKTQHVLLQQKPGKQAVVTNLQVKTPQGYTNLPVQLRAAAKPVPIKQDLGPGQVKMVSIAGGAKILPKPSQPVYVVPGTTTPLPMVTRTVPVGCPSRVMTVSTTGNVKWNQSSAAAATGPVKSVQMLTQQRRSDGVVLVQKGVTAKTIASHSLKDGSGTKTIGKSGQKPLATISSSLAQSLQQLSNSQHQTGPNLILLDMNQEKISGNAVLADFLQASVMVPESEGKIVPVDIASSGEDANDSDLKDDKDESIKDDAIPITTLSIEEAVEMLNRSDTPETRALLSQAGIQISDEIADSEEEEQVVEKSPQSDELPTSVGGGGGGGGGGDGKSDQSGGPREIDLLQDAAGFGNQLPTAVTVSVASVTSDVPITSSAGSPSLPTAVHTLASRRTLDIYSTALASANINLDSFMEEEDEPEHTSDSRVQGDKEEEATDSAADSSSDPLDMQLAELTSEMSQ